DVTVLKEDVKVLKEDVTVLKEDVTVLKEDVTVLKEDVTVLKIEMKGARADILQIRESQADLRDRLIEHSEDLKVIKDKQDAHSELLGQLINIGEETKTTQAEHTKRFDKLGATQAEQGDLLKLILDELRKPRQE
ncbi:MAG TPA: hypothetical protein VN207_01925, partial [Ktedonobacteraceae bacterium]|nr:hypothetical protein [Ktedonobacteraceae bacterium]